MKYTLCFSIISDYVLLLYRKNKPNSNFWNGIGGKIKTDEHAIDCLYREVKEEADIDLSSAQIQYSGVVCWNTSRNGLEGMFCFLAYPAPDIFFLTPKTIDEGILAWKKIDWALDKNNKEVVSNIHYFLPHMLSNTDPYEYQCYYQKGILERITIRELEKGYSLE